MKFLGTLIPADLSLTAHTTAVIKEAQQQLQFLRVLRKNNLDKKLLVTFYRSSFESLLMYCMTVWYASGTEGDRRRIQKLQETAQTIIHCPLPSLIMPTAARQKTL